eukprot:576801-Hanusia_phi.AAC.1
MVVNTVHGKSCIAWRAPCRPELAAADEIPAVVTFVKNEEVGPEPEQWIAADLEGIIKDIDISTSSDTDEV